MVQTGYFASNPNTYVPECLDVYTVKLTATSDAGCVSTITKAVIINPNPSASFLGQDVCFRDSANFTNLSAISSGSFTSFWEFGDGFTSIDNEPAYLYSAAGTYNVTLVVTSGNGCIDSATRAITIYSSPLVSFNATGYLHWRFNGFPATCLRFREATVNSVIWNFGDELTVNRFRPIAHVCFCRVLTRSH